MTPEKKLRVHAEVRLSLVIPAERLELMLEGTEYEGRHIGDEPESEYEGLAVCLGEIVGENLADLLDYADPAYDVECVW